MKIATGTESNVDVRLSWIVVRNLLWEGEFSVIDALNEQFIISNRHIDVEHSVDQRRFTTSRLEAIRSPVIVVFSRDRRIGYDFS
jgi:hypothetical protein